MPAKKIRIELFDNEGNKYKISLEGQVTRDKAVRLLDLVELLGGMPNEKSNSTIYPLSNKQLSKYNKVQMTVQKYFPIVWFSSREIQSIYEEEFQEPIGLSTVSTYLARMEKRGILIRTGTHKNLKYKITPNVPLTTLKQQIV